MSSVWLDAFVRLKNASSLVAEEALSLMVRQTYVVNAIKEKNGKPCRAQGHS